MSIYQEKHIQKSLWFHLSINILMSKNYLKKLKGMKFSHCVLSF